MSDTHLRIGNLTGMLLFPSVDQPHKQFFETVGFVPHTGDLQILPMHVASTKCTCGPYERTVPLTTPPVRSPPGLVVSMTKVTV